VPHFLHICWLQIETPLLPVLLICGDWLGWDGLPFFLRLVWKTKTKVGGFHDGLGYWKSLVGCFLLPKVARSGFLR